MGIERATMGSFFVPNGKSCPYGTVPLKSRNLFTIRKKETLPPTIQGQSSVSEGFQHRHRIVHRNKGHTHHFEC